LAVLKGGTRELDNDEFNRLVKSSGVIEEELLRKGLVVKRGGKKVRMVVRDAFERAGEVEGYDRIKGSSSSMKSTGALWTSTANRASMLLKNTQKTRRFLCPISSEWLR